MQHAAQLLRLILVTSNGERSEINIDPNAGVLTLYKMIHRETGVCPGNQELSTICFKDWSRFSKTVGATGIKSGDVIQVSDARRVCNVYGALLSEDAHNVKRALEESNPFNSFDRWVTEDNALLYSGSFAPQLYDIFEAIVSVGGWTKLNKAKDTMILLLLLESGLKPDRFEHIESSSGTKVNLLILFECGMPPDPIEHFDIPHCTS